MASYLLKSEKLDIQQIGLVIGQDLNFDIQKNPDILILTPIEGEGSIKSNMLDEINSWLNYKPFSLSYKLLVIFPAHKMTPTLQNQLLKSLEEHADFINIVLVTHLPNLLLKTIVSRLTTFKSANKHESINSTLDIFDLKQIDAISKNREEAILQLKLSSLNLKKLHPKSIRDINIEKLYLKAIQALKSSSNTKLTLINLAISIKKVKSNSL